jgi:4-hydroxy-tetrahydrodipicolinate reductase
MSLKLLINGAAGRMGRAIAAASLDQPVQVVAEIEAGDDINQAAAKADVIIDFSVPSATGEVITAAVRHGKALVIGTTGHAAAEREELRRRAEAVPTVWAGNFSIGVNLLFHLVEQATAALPPGYDIEIVEMHHRFKKDAPSGTAARLAEIVLQQRQLQASNLRHGREGLVGERQPSEVGMHALRGGDVVGDHTVIFSALGERLELAHKASDRSIFAAGAITAARWIANQPPGLYDMQDVLGLRRSS